MRVTIFLSDEVGEKAEELAKDGGVSVSTLCNEVIEAYVKEERRKRAFERINSLIGNAYVAPDFREQLDEMRKESDRDFE